MFQGIRSSGSLSAEAVSNIKEYGRPLAALFSLRPHSFLLRKKRMGASEEASSIPFPPGQRKLHIRSLLLPTQIVTVSLGHNLAIWNFTTPHAILMMAGRRNFVDTVCRGGRSCPPGALHIRNAKPFGEIVLPYGPTESSAPTRRWIGRECSRFRTFSFFSNINRKATQRSGRLLERKKKAADMEFSPPRRKRNGAGFF